MMRTGTRVRNREGGAIGHIISDNFGCCSDKEDLIVYEGTNTGYGTDRNLLEEVEQIAQVPELIKCGAGKREDCCIFLTVSGSGPCCERFTLMRDQLIFRTMIAERNPVEPYPECMKF